MTKTLRRKSTRRLAQAVALVIMIYACSGEKAPGFVWDEDIARLTDKQIGGWLRKAPFTNEFRQSEAGEIMITNAQQVFPFLSRYYDAEGELDRPYNDNDPIFYQEAVLYDDPQWGNLFVSGMLLYDDREMFLEESYLELGNPFFEGTNGAANTHSATLYETTVAARNDRYKTGIYWAGVGFDRYLLGFYQQGQLVFEAVVPLLETDTLASLNKLKEINMALGLNIREWDGATVGQLQRIDQPTTFWKDPFAGIYLDPTYLLPSVYLKIKDTPFEEAGNPNKGDHFFSYRSAHGEVELYTQKKKTDLDEAGFNEASRNLNQYEYRTQPIFYEEIPAGTYTEGTATTYFKNNTYIEVHYRFPAADEGAEAHIHGILKRIRVSTL